MQKHARPLGGNRTTPHVPLQTGGGEFHIPLARHLAMLDPARVYLCKRVDASVTSRSQTTVKNRCVSNSKSQRESLEQVEKNPGKGEQFQTWVEKEQECASELLNGPEQKMSRDDAPAAKWFLTLHSRCSWWCSGTPCPRIPARHWAPVGELDTALLHQFI